MNDEAREVLVAAALRGHRQVKGFTHGHEGECALGVLHLAFHATREEAVECWDDGKTEAGHDWAGRFGITTEIAEIIAGRNDFDGQDFLTIARKVGRDGDV